MAPPSDQHERPVSRAHGGEGITPGYPRTRASSISLAADWVAASLARDAAESWLQANRWPPAQSEELVLAVSEAVSNSVEHGYRVSMDQVDHSGIVRLTFHVENLPDGFRRVVISIGDRGAWREPDDGPTHRGHGLLLMRSATDRMHIHKTATGTEVQLVSRPVPPPPRRA